MSNVCKEFYPILMILLIFAESMEFVAANLFLVTFNPINALFLTLIVNAIFFSRNVKLTLQNVKLSIQCVYNN